MNPALPPGITANQTHGSVSRLLLWGRFPHRDTAEKPNPNRGGAGTNRSRREIMKVILLRETFIESLAKDVTTVAFLVGATLLGLWVGSDALQWIGGFLALVVVCAKAASAGRNAKMTIPEARSFLDQLERTRND